MELAIVSDEISLDLEEAIRFGRESGIRKYEIRCIDDYKHRVPDIPEARISMLEDLVSGEGMEITALSPGTFKIFPGDTAQLDRELQDILPRCCEMARWLGASRVITFGFMRETGVDMDEVVNRLREAGTIAREFGLELSIENEPGSYCDTGIHTASMIRAIGMDTVGVNWDPANAVYANELAYPVGYDAVLPHIQNVHIKDGIPLPPDKWENRLIGDGGVNWIGQLTALLRDRPVPFVTLETHVFPLVESTREDLRRLRVLFEAAQEFSNTTAQ